MSLQGENIRKVHKILWGSIKKAGESKAGNSLGVDKKQSRETYFLYVGGYRIVNIYST